MKEVVSLILLLTCIATDAENEATGPSDYLKTKWREYYSALSLVKSPRCFRTCSPDENDLYRNVILGKAPPSVTESEFIEILTNAFKASIRTFIESVQENTTLGVQYLDADQNDFISAEEYYTEFLCMGIELEKIKTLFDSHKPVDNGIPTTEYNDTFVEFMTNNNDPNMIYDVLKNTVLDGNTTIPT